MVNMTKVNKRWLEKQVNSILSESKKDTDEKYKEDFKRGFIEGYAVMIDKFEEAYNLIVSGYSAEYIYNQVGINIFDYAFLCDPLLSMVKLK